MMCVVDLMCISYPILFYIRISNIASTHCMYMYDVLLHLSNATSHYQSSHFQRKNLPALTYDEAQEDCAGNNGTLTIFPAIEEMEIVNQVLTIEVKINLNREKESAPHRYWIGAKWDETLHDPNNDHSSEYIIENIG